MESECFENRVYLINSYMTIYHLIIVEPYMVRHQLFFIVRKGGGAGIFIYSFENDNVPCLAKRSFMFQYSRLFPSNFNEVFICYKMLILRLTRESIQIKWFCDGKRG